MKPSAVHLKVKKRVLAKIKKMGIPIPMKPKREAELPKDITKVGGRELGRLLQDFTGWHAHANFRLSFSDIAVTVLEVYLKDMRAMSRARSEEKTVAKADAKMEVKTKYRTYAVEHMNQVALHTVLKSVVEGFDAKGKAVSREISRREQEFERSKRS